MATAIAAVYAAASPEVPEYVIAVPALTLFAYLVYRNHRIRRQREARTREAAQRAGWQWKQRDDTLIHRWTLVEAFGRIRRRSARNIVSGLHNGWRFLAFDYYWSTGGVRGSRQHHSTVHVLFLAASLPTIRAETEGFLGGRIARAFGHGGLLLGDDELDATWRIRAEDEDCARAVFHDGMRRLLRETGPWTWSIQDDTMVSIRSGTLRVEEIGPRLDLMATVLGQVPDEVWRTYATPIDDSHPDQRVGDTDRTETGGD